MTPIPLYDETAPIACTITDQEIPDRVRLAERLRDQLVRLEHTEYGMVLHFENHDDVEADIRQFAIDEKRCCQFWGFEVVRADSLTLRWEGPPDAREIVDYLADWFQGTGSISLHIAGFL